MSRASALLLLVVGTLPPQVTLGEDWTQFRGPTGLGYTSEKNLPVRWGGPENENVLWKSPLVGEGHASPVVHGDYLFVSTVRWDESVKNRAKVIPEHHVLCYRTSDGKRLWDTEIVPGPWLRDDFRSGPGGGYAAPTPAVDDRHVYAVFGSSVMVSLDRKGHVVWRKVMKPHTFDVTVGSSPVLYKNTLVMLYAMSKKEDSKIAAYDKSDGSLLWETRMPHTHFGHATPALIEAGGRKQLVVAASGMRVDDRGIQSFDPDGDKLLWWCRGRGGAASAAFGGGIVYSDSGRGGPGVAIDPTGSGDVSKSHVRWRIPQVPDALGSPVVVGDHVYRLHNPKILKAWHIRDGKQIHAVRLDRLTSTWASPIVDPEGRLFLASAGVSYVVQTGAELKVLSINDLGDPNHASPAAANGRLYFAGTKNVFCVGSK